MTMTLRRLRPEDRYDLASLANNKKIWDNLRDQMPHPFGLHDADAFIKAKMHQEHDYVFVIAKDDKLAGMIGLHPQKDVYRNSLELGYWVGEEYWGQGLASKAVRSILEFGFSLSNINRIFAGVLAYNKASMKVLERNGFQLEGIARKASTKNDVIWDEWRYAILKEEFDSHR